MPGTLPYWRKDKAMLDGNGYFGINTPDLAFLAMPLWVGLTYGVIALCKWFGARSAASSPGPGEPHARP